MKMINLLKNATGTIAIFTLLLSLAACGNTISDNADRSLSGVEGPVEETSENTADTPITVTGIINIKGAAPRSATSSFSDIKWFIKATSADFKMNGYKSDGSPNVTAGAYSTSSPQGNTFSLSFIQEGKWNIYVSGYPSDTDFPSFFDAPTDIKPLFTGKKENLEVKADISNLVIQATISTEENTQAGTISLAMSAPASIKKVKALLKKYQSEPVSTLTKEAAFEGGNTSLFVEDVPVGSYTVNLSFEDEIGNTLYTCTEALTVYAGMITDTWFGTAPYLVNDEDTIKFVLTQAMLDSYDADIVPSTDYLLYDSFYDEQENEHYYNYYFMNDYENELPAAANLHNDSDTNNSFAFDADGYYYVVTETVESAIFIKSNKPGFCSESASDAAYQYPGSMYINGFIGDKILVDRKTGFLYLIDKSNGADIGINRLTKDNGTYVYESEQTHAYNPAKVFHIPETDANRSIVVDSTAFTIYGGIGYFVCMENDKLQIAVVDLRNYDSNSTNADASVSNMFEIQDINVSTYSSSISDVIYMDGELYILLKDYNPDGALKSHGMLIKCNTITGAYKTVGFAPEKMLMSYKAGVYYNDNVNHFSSFLYNSRDEDKSDYYIADFLIENEEDQLVIQAPFNNLDSYFVGPQKFIAIKPKKLVISDTGIAFYTDADGAVYYKNVNRIVEVDLKTLSLSSSTDVDVTFDTPHENNGLSQSGLPSVTTSSELQIWNSASGRWDSVSAGTTLQCGFIKKQ